MANNPGSVEPQVPASQQTNTSKLPNFLLWREGSSRFLPRARSQSAHRPAHPLQSSLHPSHSTPDLTMAVAAAQSQPTQPKILLPESSHEGSLSDPKTPGSASTVSRTDSVVDGLPDLNDEISKLNEKLVDAINHQFSLDDALQQTRHELEIARKNLERLEIAAKEHAEKMRSGLLIPKEDVDRREAKLSSEAIKERESRISAERRFESDLTSEKEARVKAEKEKKAMEQELETLTSALFQEANTMVADARKEKEASDKKIDQLKNQLRDSEVLLSSHQEQLANLKVVMEKMVEDQTETDSVTNNSTNPPSSPAIASTKRHSKVFEAGEFSTPDQAIEATPDQPLHYAHLIQPVLRTDVTAYQDFAALMKQARAASPPPSRVVSGSFSSLAAISASANASTSIAKPSSPATPSFASVPVSSTPGSFPTAPQAPTLRETKVFKRALVEDIDPTLRLDIAPGVSWISRRPIVNSMIDGSLVVEPMPTPPVKFRGPVNQCSLCGENRIGETYARNHRFRISENKENKRFPLCELCLGRLRSCCDLLSFLRMVTGGHWRADSEDEVKAAWEEYVRLRERMFWHRVSGGVVPVNMPQSKEDASSPRSSIEAAEEEADSAQLQAATDSTEIPPVDIETFADAAESQSQLATPMEEVPAR